MSDEQIMKNKIKSLNKIVNKLIHFVQILDKKVLKLEKELKK